MDKMIKCKGCGEEISKKAKICPKCGRKVVSPVLSILVTLIILIVIIFAVAGVAGNKTKDTEQQSEKITLEKFNKIETGMTYQEVVDIIGEEGTILSESNITGNEEYHTIMYSWKAKDGIANANVTVQGGKVVSKAQIGLK